MAVSTAHRVADGLVNLAHDHEQPITNLKLQKLLYYAQAWHLALFSEPLFDEPIEAWVHGPVVPSIFRRYKECRWNHLPRVEWVSAQTPAVKDHLTEVWRVYGKFDAFGLEKLTHSETPWQMARAGLPSDAPSHSIISHASMREYYASRVNG
jgi:uncharacterized phage-associated protein